MTPDEFRSITLQVIVFWSRAFKVADRATTDAQFAEALERLKGVRKILNIETSSRSQHAYRQALLVLLEDTVLWAEAKRDGGDAAAAHCDLKEAYTIVCMEADRLFGTS
jgi:hypothetical protein